MSLAAGGTPHPSSGVVAVRWLALLALLMLAVAPTLGTGLAQPAPTTLVSAQGALVVHSDGEAETAQNRGVHGSLELAAERTGSFVEGVRSERSIALQCHQGRAEGEQDIELEVSTIG